MTEPTDPVDGDASPEPEPPSGPTDVTDAEVPPPAAPSASSEPSATDEVIDEPAAATEEAERVDTPDESAPPAEPVTTDNASEAADAMRSAPDAPATTEAPAVAADDPMATAALAPTVTSPTDDAAATAASQPVASTTKHWPRRITTGVLIALAGLLFVVATVAVWAKRTVLSTDRVVAAVDAAASDEAVIQALSTRVTDQIMTLIDNTGIVNSILPGSGDRLAPVINAAIANAVDQQVNKLLSSDDGRELLNTAVRKTHEQVIRILKGEGLPDNSLFVVANGTVSLDLISVVERVIDLLQNNGIINKNFDLSAVTQSVQSNDKVQALAKAFNIKLPDDFGQIVLFQTDAVDNGDQVVAQAQRALQIFERATIALVILALVFLILAVVASVDKRRTALQLGLVIGVLSVLLHIVVNRVTLGIGNAIAAPGAQAAAVEITQSLTSSLKRSTLILALLAFLVALIAFLVRPRATGDAWLVTMVRRSPDMARLVVVGFCLLLLVIAGLSAPSVLIALLLGIAGILAIGALTRRVPVS